MSQWFAHHGTVQSSCSKRKMLVYPIMFTVSCCFCFHIKVISLKFEFFQICHDFITWNFFLLWQIVELNCTYLRFIKTHICVSRKWDVCKWSEYIDRNNKVAIFMHPQLHDVLSNWHQIYCGVTSMQGRPYFKFEQDPLSHFQNTSQPNFINFFFLHHFTNSHMFLFN